MYRDNARYKLFTRRALMVGGGKVALLGLLAGRLYQLQVLESDQYALQAEENRVSVRLVPPPRGRIFDRNGELLAVNRENYRLLLVPEQSKDVEGTIDAVAQLLSNGDMIDRKRIMREVRRQRSFVPILVRENLPWDDVARIEEHAPDLPGIMIDVGQSRDYLYGPALAHVIGYVAQVSEAEQGDDPLLALPGFRVGKAGVERVYDAALRGRAGTSQLEVNAVGRVIRELKRNEGQPGADIATTIDLDLQKLALDRLAKHVAASAVTIDVDTGDVLAMASWPGFEPGAFNQGLTGEQWRSLISDPLTPLNNKAISGVYAPGSTFKVAVALAALDRGVDPEMRVFCKGYTQLGDAKFHCWKKHGHGSVGMVEAIEQSCDCYFYEVSRRIGVDAIAAMANRLGLGLAAGIDIPGEKAGLIPTRKWKKDVTGVAWQPGESLVAGIGQGFVLATPLQLAVMTARVASGGRAVVPRLVRKPPRESEPQQQDATFSEIGLNQAHLKIVIEGMRRVANSPRGTAYRARILDKGFEMAGKSGTSQVRRISASERDASGGVRKREVPWKEQDHALFVGFAPLDRPRYATAVVIEHGIGGSAFAAPVVRDLLLEAQRIEKRRGGDKLARLDARPS
jgi:penicillin-binding protein 2